MPFGGDGISRRQLLGTGAALGGAALAAGPAAAWARHATQIASRAAAVRPHGSDLGAIEHIVILMMENRSYDHLFGCYPLGQGFNDHPATNDGAFEQPYPKNPSLNPPNVLLPFYFGGPTCSEDQSHGWGTTHSAWNNGEMNQFATSLPPRTMGYYMRKDVPFHWAMADYFTLCDSYHCSVLGPTHPNRLMALSGTIDPAGASGGPVTNTNSSPDWEWTLTWPTIQEVLEDAGVSWKYYNPSNADVPGQFAPLLVGPTETVAWNPALYNPTTDASALGVGDNVLPYFKNFKSQTSPLYQKAFNPTYPGDFYRDCQAGTLPAVSWIGPPIGFDFHPSQAPDNAEWLIAQTVAALSGNAEMWSKTALFVTYDEGGGFFDHVSPPTAPPGTAGEYITAPNPSPSASLNQVQSPLGPVGFGLRVPMMVVSPFSRGGGINSDLFDHTSQIQLIEQRFGVSLDNISAWRRQTSGDLTSTLSQAADTSMPDWPATQIYMPLGGPCVWSNQDTDSGGVDPGPPTQQTMPTQGGVANEPPVSTTTAVHDEIVVELLESGHDGPVRVNVYATTQAFENVVIRMARGTRLLASVKMKSLKTTPTTVELHHKIKLKPGLIRIAVYVSGKRHFDHVFHLDARHV